MSGGDGRGPGNSGLGHNGGQASGNVNGTSGKGGPSSGGGTDPNSGRAGVRRIHLTGIFITITRGVW
ncbi:hypothetical protein AL516_01250 (plasmid) [Klebsiella pneumoniae]|nr:hypothetical protein AL516_01250 [Klebsiella pneumoniae]